MTTATAVARQIISLPELRTQQLTLTLIGDTPLISNKWSEKARTQMREKQQKKAKHAKEAKDPWQCFVDSLYWLTPRPAQVTEATFKKARFGFPAIAFKSAAVDACSHIDGITKVEARGSFHIDSDLIEIETKLPPEMREDMVRNFGGVADLRYRAAFRAWRVNLPLTYNVNLLTPEQIVNLFNTAGFGIGIGDWRPARDGGMGRFHVAKETEL